MLRCIALRYVELFYPAFLLSPFLYLCVKHTSSIDTSRTLHVRTAEAKRKNKGNEGCGSRAEIDVLHLRTLVVFAEASKGVHRGCG